MKIIHLRQSHNIPEVDLDGRPFELSKFIMTDLYNLEGDFLNAVIRSQFMVIQEIRKYPQYPVVFEGTDVNRIYDPDSPGCKAVKLCFPNGFPQSFSELTSKQKKALYFLGADEILVYLGEIDCAYKSIHSDVALAIHDQMDSVSHQIYATGVFPPEIDKLNEVREKEAMLCVNEAAIQHISKGLDGSTVILVFGAAHNFHSYCETMGFEYERINTFLTRSNTVNPLHSNSVEVKQQDSPRTSSRTVNDVRMFAAAVTDTSNDHFVKHLNSY